MLSINSLIINNSIGGNIKMENRDKAINLLKYIMELYAQKYQEVSDIESQEWISLAILVNIISILISKSFFLQEICPT